ncbi:hypothetical protein AAC387_Pa02g4292 [Persea americana]
MRLGLNASCMHTTDVYAVCRFYLNSFLPIHPLRRLKIPPSYKFPIALLILSSLSTLLKISLFPLLRIPIPFHWRFRVFIFS